VTTSELLDALWRDYAQFAPQADRIRRLLIERGEVVHDDHIGLWTFDVTGIDLAAMAAPFEACGWVGRERYSATAARARYWQHDNPDLPKIFISEVVVDELSPAAQAVVRKLELPDKISLPSARTWSLSQADYEAIDHVGAAWVAAMGFRVHHVTVDANALASFPDRHALVAFLGEHMFETTDVASARRIEITHVAGEPISIDGAFTIPGARYEMVWRYEPVSVAK
jgi:hypothetical protein